MVLIGHKPLDHWTPHISIKKTLQIEEDWVWCLSDIWHPKVQKFRFLQSWKWIKSEKKDKEGGEIALIIKPNMKYVLRKDLEVPGIEAVYCEIVIENSRILLISV